MAKKKTRAIRGKKKVTTNKKTTKRRAVRKKTASKRPARKKKATTGRVAGKKTAPKKKAARKKRRTRDRRLSTASNSESRTELARRDAAVMRLEKKRERVADQLAQLDAEISRVQGQTGGPRPPGNRQPARGRPRNRMTLVQALQRVLKGRTLSVSEAAVAIGKIGYRSKSPHLRVMVNQALLANTSIFKKVARGQYTAK